MPELKVSGRVLTTNTVDERNAIYREISEKLAESAQKSIRYGFERSVQLAAMVGAAANQEAVRSILRSLVVDVKSVDPTISLEAKFEDSLAHWTGTDQGMPEDISKLLQEIINDSLNSWMRDGEPGKILSEVLNA